MRGMNETTASRATIEEFDRVRDRAHPVFVVGVRLTFGDAMNLLLVFFLAQLLLAAIVGAFALLFWYAAVR